MHKVFQILQESHFKTFELKRISKTVIIGIEMTPLEND